MRRIFKKTLGRIQHKCTDAFTVARMLVSPTHRKRDAAEAISYLQNISPDLGKTCRINRTSDYETRRLPLSVIVPAFNVEKSIVACLDSILQQQASFTYEVIVVNDGSTDLTPTLLKNYEHDPRVRIIHQNNGGLSAARNTGIAHAKGNYLCFVDSDDELPEYSLESLMRPALRHNAKLVVGSYEACFREGKARSVKQLKDQKTDSLLLPGFAWGKVIHYTIFENLAFPENYWFEDSVMDQIVHPVCQESTYTISNVAYKYYFNEAGITATSKGKPKSLDSLWITMRLLEERKEFGLSYTQFSYSYFLLMVGLTYRRTKYLGVEVAKCIFDVQKMLLDRYYAHYQMEDDSQKRKIQEALRTNSFRRYVLACEKKC